MPLDEPSFVVKSRPALDCKPHLLGVPEGSRPEKLLFQRTKESLDAAVALRRPNERRAGGDAEEVQLLLEGVADVLASVVMSNNQASGDLFAVGAKPFTDALTDRLKRFKTGGPLGRMDAHAFCRAVIHRGEDRDRAFLERVDAGRIGAPHLIGSLRNDRPVMNAGAKDPCRA